MCEGNVLSGNVLQPTLLLQINMFCQKLSSWTVRLFGEGGSPFFVLVYSCPELFLQNAFVNMVEENEKSWIWDSER